MECGLKIPDFGPNDVYHMHSIVVREVFGTSFLRILLTDQSFQGAPPLRFDKQI